MPVFKDFVLKKTLSTVSLIIFLCQDDSISNILGKMTFIIKTNFTCFFLLFFLTWRLKIENYMHGLLDYISAGQHCSRRAFGHCFHLPLDLSVSLLEDSPHLVVLVALFLVWDLQAQCWCSTGVPCAHVPVCSAPTTAPSGVFSASLAACGSGRSAGSAPGAAFSQWGTRLENKSCGPRAP